MTQPGRCPAVYIVVRCGTVYVIQIKCWMEDCRTKGVCQEGLYKIGTGSVL